MISKRGIAARNEKKHDHSTCVSKEDFEQLVQKVDQMTTNQAAMSESFAFNQRASRAMHLSYSECASSPDFKLNKAAAECADPIGPTEFQEENSI